MQGSDQPTPPPIKASRFWNLRIAGYWLGLALIGVAVFLLRAGWQRYLGAGVAAYGLYAATVSLLGVVVARDGVALPHCVHKRMPVLVRGRMWAPLSELKEITAFGKFMEAELVMLSIADGESPALFASREQRLAFFAAVKSLNPEIKIYRAF